MFSKFDKRKRRAARAHYRKRGKLPLRLVVSRKNKNFHVQVIDDINEVTLYHVSTLSRGFKLDKKNLNSGVVERLGDYFNNNIPESLKGQSVVFDTGSSAYHGLVVLFACKVRECLKF